MNIYRIFFIFQHSIACCTSPCLLLVLSKLSHKYSTFIQLPTWKPVSAQERTETISEFNTEKCELMWFTEGTGGYAVLRSELELTLPCCVLCCLCMSVLHVCFSLSQINHKYPERRLLVAEACGALAPYLPVRDSVPFYIKAV